MLRLDVEVLVGRHILNINVHDEILLLMLPAGL